MLETRAAKPPSPQTLQDLRARLRVLERGEGRGPLKVLPLGPALLDAHLPGGGLPLAGLHEIAGERAEWDDGAAAGFTLALLTKLAAALPGPILWVASRLDLYAPGLCGFGLAPQRLLLTRAGGDAEVFWALEEGLRSGALAAVVGEVGDLERTASRRLQLAAEAAERPCLLLRRRLYARRQTEGPSAALTRWRVAPLSSEAEAPAEAAQRLFGRPRWRAELLRCRGAAPADFLVEWDDAAGDFALAAAFRDGPLVARPAAPPGRHGVPRGTPAVVRLAG